MADELDQQSRVISKKKVLALPEELEGGLLDAVLASNLPDNMKVMITRLVRERSHAASDQRLYLHLIGMAVAAAGGEIEVSQAAHKTYTDQIIRPRSGRPPDIVYEEIEGGGIRLKIEMLESTEEAADEE